MRDDSTEVKSLSIRKCVSTENPVTRALQENLLARNNSNFCIAVENAWNNLCIYENKVG